ncbi:hypothetical protein [Sphaerothrix gracilis]|uniref:hypothetical protein n=1 Tax=Sphaerothrix gracilis TaxID=3151835 RepID=UPI0031FDC228
MKIAAASFAFLVGLSLIGCNVAETEPDAADSSPMSADISTPAADSDTSATAETAEANDFLIVPGERVGPITEATTYDDLVTLFGEAALTNTTWPGPEGSFNLPATEVDLGPDQSFLAVWLDEARSQLFSITQLGRDWQTPEGIHVGMPLSELEAVLGPFQLSGFGWDYGGYAFLEGTELAEYQGDLYIRLSPASTTAVNEADMIAVSGDRVFDSDNPNLQAVDPTVVNLDVEFRQLE